MDAVSFNKYPDGMFIAAGPTWTQAKNIFWRDLKNLVPEWAKTGTSESLLHIYLRNGAQIAVVGLDKPERVEGTPIDGGVIDEIGNVHRSAWTDHVRPMLTDRDGWMDLIGVPEGRNHYYDLATEAELDESGEWGYYHWTTEEILHLYKGLDKARLEIASAKRDLDELSYAQEYLGSFVHFEGRAYYAFDRGDNCWPLVYEPKMPLIFTFDFNKAPGTAAIVQEGAHKEIPASGVLGEVFIPRDSNTPRVCKELMLDWHGPKARRHRHQGDVYIYGDATGGAGGSAKIDGSDWDLVKKELAAANEWRLRWRVRDSNPSERARVNAVNSRIKGAGGVCRLLVDPRHAPKMARDLDGVMTEKGGSGKLDKKSDSSLTHLSDGLGYYIQDKFPTSGGGGVVSREM